MQSHSAMRFKEATVVTSVLILVVAGCLYWLGYTDLLTMDPANDSGATQGFAIFAGALIVAQFVTVFIFPFAGLSLDQQASFTWRRWTQRVFASTGILSLVAASIAFLAIDGTLLDIPTIITLALMFYGISIIFLVPFAYFWKFVVNRNSSLRINTNTKGIPD